MKDLEIYHNITTSGRSTENFCGNWYGIGMEWYGILWNSMDQLELHNNRLSSIISPPQAAVLKISGAGGLVEQHGISALQLDTGYILEPVSQFTQVISHFHL